ncbi:Hypothetical predicted protein [Olea europaea subsp. europaea]|uniref:Uncharacterized protein n=1 Tax=Olea europaea subsp. europaea TaxID=158383 RepID=A0A8S0V2D3_OLEEU|nr:Hypothetical predicted protein [Olea europaea subsp. europaea]
MSMVDDPSLVVFVESSATVVGQNAPLGSACKMDMGVGVGVGVGLGMEVEVEVEVEVEAEMARAAVAEKYHNHMKPQYHPVAADTAETVAWEVIDTDIWKTGLDIGVLKTDEKEVKGDEDFTRPAFFASSAAYAVRTEVKIYWDKLEAVSLNASSAVITATAFSVLCASFVLPSIFCLFNAERTEVKIYLDDLEAASLSASSTEITAAAFSVFWAGFVLVLADAIDAFEYVICSSFRCFHIFATSSASAGATEN